MSLFFFKKKVLSKKCLEQIYFLLTYYRMFECRLCENETCITTNVCTKCRRIKHLLNLYGDRVYEVLEAVLIRSEDKQELKIQNEIKNEKDKIDKKINQKKN